MLLISGFACIEIPLTLMLKQAFFYCTLQYIPIHQRPPIKLYIHNVYNDLFSDRFMIYVVRLNRLCRIPGGLRPKIRGQVKQYRLCKTKGLKSKKVVAILSQSLVFIIGLEPIFTPFACRGSLLPPKCREQPS